MNYRVYVLRNPDGRFYIGLTDDVGRRVEQHNTGISKWTSGRGPWTLIWQSEARSLSEARKLELLLKRQKGGAGFYRITGLQPRAGS
jgi:putative endonuclease